MSAKGLPTLKRKLAIQAQMQLAAAFRNTNCIAFAASMATLPRRTAFFVSISASLKLARRDGVDPMELAWAAVVLTRYNSSGATRPASFAALLLMVLGLAAHREALVLSGEWLFSGY